MVGESMVEEERRGLEPLLLQELGLKPRQIKPLRSSFRIDEYEGSTVLKQSQLSLDELQFITECQSHLLQKGFDRFSAIQKNIKGEVAIQFDQKWWTTSTWIEGKESDYDRRRDLEATITALTQFHKASRGFCRPLLTERFLWKKWPYIFQRKLADIDKCYELVAQKERLGTFDRLFLQGLEEAREEAKGALALLQRSKYDQLMDQEMRKGGFCHHDLAHHNVIIGRQGEAFFLDFDYAIQDSRLHDLGSLMIRVLKRQRWSLKKGLRILECYHASYPLQRQELLLLLSFIFFPNDFWQYSWSYYFEQLERAQDFHLKRMRRFLERQKYRRLFLKDFAGKL
ncbi:CotS family spore coat protein [Heliorestis acidaminivorans]|uniref:CotS family spore coat protein n=1 Tax=Heliorestis acidaminivorans TaxID=553427 RepID=A0A6I0F0C6_9FIRM|nr:CotS family spore coat protein [Heliorestis acidaminivorans]KAB2951714.1 CotS family spore coat protein [Heliorestis acidaminivorans]